MCVCVIDKKSSRVVHVSFLKEATRDGDVCLEVEKESRERRGELCERKRESVCDDVAVSMNFDTG